ncbi:hypothetical protein IC762_12735 [Bradyrhizobium genosp. L]|uniref:hypothetical protein n=1 Tax=Bradyrhizobium genosp. L TaxID=83637 RepID=UPI0018A26E37|nr:hypothetical protein [Bradyrhizobium genosp. L]QPF87106.1 hypothetical protein IC762_12735 [Bradyrhizobium genosp. L]
MSLAYFALIVSIVSASNLDIAGARFGAQLGTMAAALSLLAASLSARKADYDHYLRASAWVRWALFVIPTLIAVQLVPIWLPLAHPIWSSAHDALGGLPTGYVTADLGLTLGALVLELSAIALIGVAIVVARDRSRAELILFVLAGVTAVSALALDLHRSVPGLVSAETVDGAPALAGFGLVLNLAVMQLAAERAETHHALSRSVAIGLAGLAGVLISAVAIFGFASTNSAVAATFGMVLLLLILVIRRLDLSTIAATALSVAALVGAGIVLAFVFEKSTGLTLLRLVPPLPAETTAALERMLADTRWLGAGAGSFAAVGQIYQSDAAALLTAPCAAVGIFADTGWIGLAAAIIVAAALLIRLFFGALQRGRDSFFPAASAGCLCFAMVEAFAGPGLLRPGAVICLAAIIGLGLSQSVGQSGR